MNKIILISIALLLSIGLKGQNTRGNLQVGFGGLPIIYPGMEDLSGYSLRANVGYFPIDKLAVGILPFAGSVNDQSSVGANIYFRYYTTNKPTALFFEGGVGLGELRYRNSPEFNGTMNAINFGPGIHHKFKNQLAIEFLVQYARLSNITFSKQTNTGNTLIPTIGVQYFIGNQNN